MEYSRQNQSQASQIQADMELIYDFREAPACIKKVWFNTDKHPNNEWRWRLLSFMRGVGISPSDAFDWMIARWGHRFDRLAVSSLQYSTTEPHWSRFREAGCVGKDRCCRSYLNSMPHHYLHEARFKYMKCPKTDKWVQYTTITNYNGQTKDVKIDEFTTGVLHIPHTTATSDQEATYYEWTPASDPYEYQQDPGPIAYYQPTPTGFRSQTYTATPVVLDDSQSSFSTSTESSAERHYLSEMD